MGCLNEDTKPEFIGQIVDIFEDYLDEKEISLKNGDREREIKDGDIEPDEAAIIYGEHYDMIGDAVSGTVNVQKLMEQPFKDMETQQKGVDEIISAFEEVLADGGYKEQIPAEDIASLKKEIHDTFKHWEVSAV